MGIAIGLRGTQDQDKVRMKCDHVGGLLIGLYVNNIGLTQWAVAKVGDGTNGTVLPGTWYRVDTNGNFVVVP
jgi:hypothetical protein